MIHSSMLASTDITTFEVLLRTYEVRQKILEGEGGPIDEHPSKRKRVTNGVECSASNTLMLRPSSEARGHTGYLTFARLKCVALS